MKKKLIFTLLLLTVCYSWSQTIFSENMGVPSSNISITSNTFENSGTLNYSNGSQANSADVRSTSPSTTAYYSGASGSGNVYFTSTSGSYGFSIESINASSYNTLSLQFGYKKESNSSHASFSVDYWNGSSWITLANTSSALFNESPNASAVWYLSKSLLLPTDAQINGLKIRFVKTGTVGIRIDDVKLTGIENAPTVINYAATSITSNSATFSGNVTATGGSSIVATGTVYSPTTSNSNPDIGGLAVVNITTSNPNTGTGSFSNTTITSLLPNVQYSYRAYATKSTGLTGYSSVDTFYTLAVTPSIPIISSVTASSLNVTIGGDTNSVITTYAIIETLSNKYVQADGTLAATVVYQTAAVWGSKVITGLTPATLYTFAVIAKNGDNVLTGMGSSANGTTASPSFGSDIYLNSSSSTNSNTNINYATYQGTTLTNTGNGVNGSVGVLGFYLRDGGAGMNDADNLPTELTGMTIHLINPENIKAIRLFVGTSPRGEAFFVNGASVVNITGLTNIIAPDNDQLAINLRVTFNSTVTDNQQVGFIINGVTAKDSGSQFSSYNGGGVNSLTSGDINRIEVTATKLEFAQQPPTSLYTGENMNPGPSVAAKDENGNVDFDAIGTVTLISSGALSNSQTAVLTSGTATFDSVKHILVGSGLFLTALHSSLASSTSSNFEVLENPNPFPTDPTIYSIGGKLEDVIDRFGNKYKLSDILISNDESASNRNATTTMTPMTSPNSIFNLYFENGSGMENPIIPAHLARRAVVNQVFEDLSNFLTTTSSPIILSGQKVNIWIRDITKVTSTPGVLGLASSYYNVPFAGVSGGGIVDGEIWRTIHTGIDSYTNVAAPLTAPDVSGVNSGLFYHGLIAFNFNTVSWNTIMGMPTPANQYDLYTVLLHEMMHALGFASMINQDGGTVTGSTVFNYYSRYDTFLRDNSAITPLIVPANTMLPMYNYGFNSSALLPSVLRPNCGLPGNTYSGSTDSTLCADALRYFSSINVPVYTPVCFEKGSSFSHFEDELYPTCAMPSGNNQYFVMSNVNGQGVTKRHLTIEERTALCDIGYQAGAEYGSSSVSDSYIDYGTGGACSGITVAGVNDGIDINNNFIFIGEFNTDIPISGSVLLANDTNAVSFEGLKDVYDPNTKLNGSTTLYASGNASSTILFRSGSGTSGPGVHVLRYVPVSASGQRGNITYVFVFVNFTASGTSICTGDSCNLVVNGGFEQFLIPPSSASNIANACGWYQANLASPDYFNAAATNSAMSVPCNFIGTQASNNGIGTGYAGMYIGHNAVNNYKYSETIFSKLSSPLAANTTYQISFDVSLAEGCTPFLHQLQVYLSPTPVAAMGAGEIPIANPAMLFTNPVFNSNTSGWDTVTFTFTTTTGGEQYIYLGALNNMSTIASTPAALVPGCPYNDGNNTPNAGRMSYYYIDNVKVQPTDGALFNLPSGICENDSFNNLAAYLSSVTTTGVFSGPGVSMVGSSYVFNASTAGPGTHTIEYTYTNLTGCQITMTKLITVGACDADLSIVKTIDASMPTVGQDITFTLTASNLSTNTATGVVVTDILPSNYTIVSALPTQGTWSGSTWNIGTLAGSASVALNIVVTVTAPVGTGNGYSNTASITYSGTDPVSGNNSSTVSPTVIYAGVDDFTGTDILVDGCSGATSSNVLGNDTINGAFVNSSDVNCSIVNDGGVGVTINSNGELNIPAGVASGTYTIRYRICQTASGYTTNCAENNVTIKIVNNAIQAVNDNFSLTPVNTLTGGNTSSVLPNDTINGYVATSANVNITYDSVTPAMLPMSPTINADGTINIPIGTTIGTYDIKYKITDVNCPANFTFGIATVLVSEVTITTPTIISGIRANNIVKQADTQSNGKIIITGSFTAYNNTASDRIARLNTDLTFDPTFTVSGPNEEVMDMKVIKNLGSPHYNKIIIVGSFTSYNGTPTSIGIARLNPDGTVDTTFNSGVIASGAVRGVSGSNNQARCIYIYPDGTPNAGKILIGGMFKWFNGESREKMVRLNSDGSVDTTFTPNSSNILRTDLGNYAGFNSTPTCFATVPNASLDDKIIVSGYFTAVNGYIVKCLARLENNGELDMSFNNVNNDPDTNQAVGFWKSTADADISNTLRVEKIVLQPDGKILAAGTFRRHNGNNCNNIVRLFGGSGINAGTVDTGFVVGSGFNNDVANPFTLEKGLVRDLILETNGSNTKLYLCGDFTAYQGIACDEVVRLNCTIAPGSKDTSFGLTGGGPNGHSNGPVWCMNKQGDGKIIIGGKFTTYDIYSALNITRILPAASSNEAKGNTVYYDSEPEIDITAVNNVTLYPNPTSGKVFFRMGGMVSYKCSVYNLLGQRIEEGIDVINGSSVNLGNLPKGVYIFVLSNDSTTLAKTIILK